MLNAQVFHLNPRLPPTVPLLPQICLCQAVQLEKQTNKKENQAQISKSSTERLSYKAPFKGPLIECTGVWCVLPLGDLPPPPPPPSSLWHQEGSFPAGAARPCLCWPTDSPSAAPCTAFTGKAPKQGTKVDLKERKIATVGGWTLN